MEHIALICDEAYVLPTRVTIQSIIDSCIGEHITIHVCTFGLSEESERQFKKMSTQLINVEVNCFSYEEMAGYIEQIPQKSHVTPTALIKFALADYFSCVDKLLYLDSDIVVAHELIELFEIDLRGIYLAAVFEFYKYLNDLWYVPKQKRKSSFYFNSGVMLLNLKLLRTDEIQKKLWHYKIHEAKTTLMDQESLNSVCGDRVIPLSIKWNFNPAFYDNSYIKRINEIYNTRYRNKDELIKDACIIHYVGKQDKPWIYNTARQGELWWKMYCRAYNKRNFDDLNLSRFQPAKGTVLQSATRIIKEHGFTGFVNYILFKLSNRG